jgi:nitrate reductase molybdenum cofactor assembly chaperone
MNVDSRFSNTAACKAPVRCAVASGRIYCLFADVLDYPSEEFFAQIHDLSTRLAAWNSEAAQLFEKFASGLRSLSLGELQELYTGTFDMRPDRTTNLGCHLFGEDMRRNLFMAQLKERMEARQIPMGCELPDHLCLVLRLLAEEESEDEARTLIMDCLTPAVTRILSTFEESAGTNPYAQALQALLAVLDRDKAVVASSGSEVPTAG